MFVVVIEVAVVVKVDEVDRDVMDDIVEVLSDVVDVLSKGL